MPNYVRAFRPGGTFFLTLVTQARAPIFATDWTRSLLRDALHHCRRHHPFVLDAMVLLPEHLHLLMTLPPGDADFSIRVANLKATFTRAYLAAGGPEQPRSASRVRQRNRGVWLKRFWEHTIRDADDLLHHYNYIHYNPVKHKHTRCPHAWPHSSFHRLAAEGRYPADWCCQCGGAAIVMPPPKFDEIARLAGE